MTTPDPRETTMRIGRAQLPDGRTYLVRIDDGRCVPLLEQPPEVGRDALREALASGLGFDGGGTGAAAALDECRLLSPVVAPQKVLAIGLNYSDHAKETGQEPPPAPILFVKTPNSIAGPGDEIRYSKDDSTQVDYEAELAVVIGRAARNVAEADALDYVLGYTACNDVSARDAQFADGQWVRGKSFDTFCPLGPWIVTADEIPDPQVLPIRCRVNGSTLQESSTAQMIFGCAQIVSYLSRFMTLLPGDVIATGTPSGVGFTRRPPVFLGEGDVVEVQIDGIGTLQNTVRVE
jgi:2-keto-4-pentenoate hydratase/2-oxohepta-3-ene-1,7-dioic acid hydratase in catechol pathway